LEESCRYAEEALRDGVHIGLTDDVMALHLITGPWTGSHPRELRQFFASSAARSDEGKSAGWGSSPWRRTFYHGHGAQKRHRWLV
jgi:hypothetical protein